MGEVFIWRLFNQVAIKPAVWGEQADAAVLDRTTTEDIPAVLDYLESQLPASGFCFESVSIADIAVATFFRNAAFAHYRIDAARWPVTAAFVARVLALESFRKLMPFEERCLRIPIAQQRAALAEMGAPLTQETYATGTPRRGVMHIE
jgi:glutathione S-transferase